MKIKSTNVDTEKVIELPFHVHDMDLYIYDHSMTVFHVS